VRVIAVAAKGSPRADVAAFTRQRFGGAPVDVYIDGSGAINRAFGVATHPTFRFVTAAGRLTTSAPAGFPLR
jgi:hypothetical protein